MNQKTTYIDIETLSAWPVKNIDDEALACGSRVIFGATEAAQSESATAARDGEPERESLFQRAMGFITRFGKAAPSELPPIDEALRTPLNDAGVRTFSSCSATLRLMLGQDYVTPTITSPRQLRCLCSLMLAPSGTGISREELDAQTGTNNSPEYVRILRQKLSRYGKLIEGEKRKVIPNGKTTRRGFYWMTGIGRLVAQDVLAKAGYIHDVAAALRHTRRLEADRQRLIAEFGSDHLAREAVLDASKPHRVRLMNLLLWKRGWISRYDIERITDAQNPPDVVSNINREFGDELIESETRQLIDRDGRVCEIGCYRIAPAWASTIEKAVRKASLVK